MCVCDISFAKTPLLSLFFLILFGGTQFLCATFAPLPVSPLGSVIFPVNEIQMLGGSPPPNFQKFFCDSIAFFSVNFLFLYSFLLPFICCCFFLLCSAKSLFLTVPTTSFQVAQRLLSLSSVSLFLFSLLFLFELFPAPLPILFHIFSQTLLPPF